MHDRTFLAEVVHPFVNGPSKVFVELGQFAGRVEIQPIIANPSRLRGNCAYKGCSNAAFPVARSHEELAKPGCGLFLISMSQRRRVADPAGSSFNEATRTDGTVGHLVASSRKPVYSSMVFDPVRGPHWPKCQHAIVVIQSLCRVSFSITIV